MFRPHSFSLLLVLLLLFCKSLFQQQYFRALKTFSCLPRQYLYFQYWLYFVAVLLLLFCCSINRKVHHNLANRKISKKRKKKNITKEKKKKKVCNPKRRKNKTTQEILKNISIGIVWKETSILFYPFPFLLLLLFELNAVNCRQIVARNKEIKTFNLGSL